MGTYEVQNQRCLYRVCFLKLKEDSRILECTLSEELEDLAQLMITDESLRERYDEVRREPFRFNYYVLEKQWLNHG